MAAPMGEQSWRAQPGKVTQRLVYIGLFLLVVVGGFVVGYADTYRRHVDRMVPYVIVAVFLAALLSWLGGKLLLRALQRAGVFGGVRVSGGRLIVGRALFDLAKALNADPRSHFKRFERDVPKVMSGGIRYGRSSHEWVWNASLQVEQEGQWATLMADDWSGILKRREARQGAEHPWAGLDVKSAEPGPPRGTTLRLAPDDLAQALRALQGCPAYTDFEADRAPGAPPPRRLFTGLKTAVGVAALLAVSFATVVLAGQHYSELGRQASRQEQQERGKAREAAEALWQPRIGRWVKLPHVKDAIVYGRLTAFEARDDGRVSLTLSLEVVEEATGEGAIRPDPQVLIGGRWVKKGDVAYVGGDDVAFEEPPAGLFKRPPAGLSRKGWAKLQEVLGDRMGRALTPEEQEEALGKFLAAGASLQDLAAAKELFSKPLPKPDAGNEPTDGNKSDAGANNASTQQ